MTQTPLQKLIANLSNMKEVWKKNNAEPEAIHAINHAIETATQFLPEEKQGIVDAYMEGAKDVSTRDNDDAEAYFNNTYKQL